MTTKLKARRFRLRRPEGAASPPPLDTAVDTAPEGTRDAPPSAPPPPVVSTAAGEETLAECPPPPAEIEREGLTGRQLRLARRMAQKHGIAAESDLEAVQLLREAGLDPFQRTALIEFVPQGEMAAAAEGRRALARSDGPALPDTTAPLALPSRDERADAGQMTEIMRIQRDIARRRRHRLMLLGLRLLVFVGLPTLLAGIYYSRIATPLYASNAEFVIQQAETPSASGGIGGLLSGTQLGTAQDSMAVQGYLQSREAMQRLDHDIGFRAHFDRPEIDALQRLDPAATAEEAYRHYTDTVKIAYDPTEGIIKLEVQATDPKTAVDFSTALISYAEQQVDHMTQRMREDQMAGARKGYEDAEAKIRAAQDRMIELQQKFKILSSELEVGLVSGRMSQLETQLTTDRLSLQQMESNPEPNMARVEPIRRRIAVLEEEIRTARARLTEDGKDGPALARVQGELMVAQSDVATRQLLLAQALQSLEAARIEANRQTRYLSLSVRPVEPDEPSYPHAFENTLVVFLIFLGLYMMVSMTVAILREQVSA